MAKETEVREAIKDNGSQSNLQSAIDGSATAMMMVDRDLNVTYANPATIKIAARISDWM